MSREGLRRAVERIIDEVEEEIIEELENSLESGKALIESAYKEALREAENLLRSAEMRAHEEARTKLSRASMEAKRVRLRAQERAIDEVVREFLNYLERSRGEEWYREALKRLIEEGLVAVGGKGIIRPAKPDYDIVKELVAELGDEIELGDPIDSSIGGIVVVSADGSIIYNNTIEARLRRFRRELRRALACVIFERC